MKKKRLRTALCIALAAAGLTAFGALAAGGAGSQSDPLVTLSYLTDTFTGQIMDKVDASIAGRDARLLQELGGSAVTLGAGQTLYGEAGCEVLLRSGAASCGASAEPGLVDTTAGGGIAGGASLQANHLYLMTDSRTVTASEGAVLLVRGVYTIA